MATSPPRFDKFHIYLVLKSQGPDNRNHYLYELEVCDDGCRCRKDDDVVKVMPRPKYMFHADHTPHFVLTVSLGSKLYFFRGISLVTVDCAVSSSSIIELKECESWDVTGDCPLLFAVAGKILVLPRAFNPAEKGLTKRTLPTVQLYEPESNSWKTLPDPDFVCTEGIHWIYGAVDSGTSVYISTRVISTHKVSTSTCVGGGVFRMDLKKPPYEWQYWRSEPLPFSGSYKEGSWFAEHNLRDLVVLSEDPSPPGMEDGDFIESHHLVKVEPIVCKFSRDFINLGKGFFCTIVTGIDIDIINGPFLPSAATGISIYYVSVQVFKIRRVKVYGDDGGLANSEKKLKRKLKTGRAHSKKHDKRQHKWKARLLYSSKYAFNSNSINPLTMESFCIMKESSIAAARGA